MNEELMITSKTKHMIKKLYLFHIYSDDKETVIFVGMKGFRALSNATSLLANVPQIGNYSTMTLQE